METACSSETLVMISLLIPRRYHIPLSNDLLFCPEDGGSFFLRNIYNDLPFYTQNTVAGFFEYRSTILP
jgi:hypothetical protein